jgi:hypothetical protein
MEMEDIKFWIKEIFFLEGYGICCGRRRNKRYDSTGLLTGTYQLIYRDCTGLLEYTRLV